MKTTDIPLRMTDGFADPAVWRVEFTKSTETIAEISMEESASNSLIE